MTTRADIEKALLAHTLWRTGSAPAAMASNLPRSEWTDAEVAEAEAWDPGERLSLDGEDLSGLDLSDLDLQHVGMVGCNLCRADLRNSDLRHANLTGACLEDARLNGATIDGTTRLSGANIGAKGCADLTSSRAVLNALGGDTVKAQHDGLARAIVGMGKG